MTMYDLYLECRIYSIFKIKSINEIPFIRQRFFISVDAVKSLEKIQYLFIIIKKLSKLEKNSQLVRG